MKDVIFNKTATVAYDSGKSAVMVLQHSQPINQQEAAQARDYYLWGADNLRPQKIVADCRKNAIIPATISWKSEILYGSGLTFGFEEVEGKNIVLQPAGRDQYPEVYNFIRSRGMRHFLRQASKAYYWWKFIAPELVLSKDRKKIVSLASQRPEYSRFKREEKTLALENMVVSANWEGAVDLKDKGNSSVVPLVNAYYQPAEWLREQGGYKYIYPCIDHSPGTVYYPEAEWHSVRESGWLKVVESIPQFKAALFKHQVTIKYLIEVSTWWWEQTYPGFGEFATERKKQIMADELQAFTNFMTGPENSGKALMISYQSDPSTGKDYAGWKITAIDNKIKDGIYIEDSQEGNSHLMYALGVDPVLKGFAPGGKMASGGSEKRVAWNNHLMSTKPHQDDILEVLDLIRDYNGWDPNLRFWFTNYYQATMDVAREPQQQAS